MGKKKITKQTKPVSKIATPAKEEKVVEKVEKVEKKIKKAAKSEQNVEVLTAKFYEKLESFQSYYREVSELKASSTGANVQSEINNVNGRVKVALEESVSSILGDELVVLQNWIQAEQTKLRGEISTVQKCYSDSQKSLEVTGFFSTGEINKQLAPIQAKIDQKTKVLNNYGNLLERSAKLHSVEKEKVQPAQNVQNDAENVSEEMSIQ